MTQQKRSKADLLAALVEADVYLAALGWWEIGNIAKAGEVIGNAIGWDKVAEINAQYAPDSSSLQGVIQRGNSGE